jgi:hypothetical protein
MKSKIRKEINKIIDSLMIELDTEETIATKVFAIAHRPLARSCWGDTRKFECVGRDAATGSKALCVLSATAGAPRVR